MTEQSNLNSKELYKIICLSFYDVKIFTTKRIVQNSIVLIHFNYCYYLQLVQSETDKIKKILF